MKNKAAKSIPKTIRKVIRKNPDLSVWLNCDFCGKLVRISNAKTVKDLQNRDLRVGSLCAHLVKRYKTYEDYRMDPNRLKVIATLRSKITKERKVSDKVDQPAEVKSA
ncbi:MAG: hypothetical protein FVQ80_14390 [Planctomycetes bacterium]|nr:hypothetical protein [Planctomycetota bacterium]